MNIFTTRAFFTQLLAISLGTLFVLLLFNKFLPELNTYQDLAWGSVLFFILFSCIAYFAGKKAAQSSNKNTFTQIVMLLIMSKMLIGASIILIYQKLIRPYSTIFVLPFFIAYIIFTFWEVAFLITLGKTQ